MTDCVFCDIVAGLSPAARVYEDDAVVAFLDIRPLARGHTLVVPRIHSSGLADLDAPSADAVFSAGRRIAGALRRSSIGADGVNLLVNDGRAAMQTVFHHHMHVVPRWNGDKLRFAAQLLTRRPHELDEVARVVREALAHEN
ncbi:HIT family protein [Rhodococcus sp. MEB064]|jgi:histidine triad (HIT) family protein|uniref:HIT family protein n=1 Tax=Rhodococcus sp. MEB064 TaxID=1587522 RepID=UPI0005AC3660|nr:HIT family protein [Rhodococcus sp. MEB064]